MIWKDIDLIDLIQNTPKYAISNWSLYGKWEMERTEDEKHCWDKWERLQDGNLDLQRISIRTTVMVELHLPSSIMDMTTYGWVYNIEYTAAEALKPENKHTSR
jgi:hypothetical protein